MWSVDHPMPLARCLSLGLAVAASASSFAWAEPKPPVSLGEGFELVTESGLGAPSLYVRKGKLRTRLGSASYVSAVHIDSPARSVTLELENACNIAYKETWAYDVLEARIENTNAYQLHQKEDYKAAVPGFARAATLDPTWNIPAYNLASAETLLGDQEAAIKALAPWLASAPVTTYVQVTTDPELAPLLARPELQAIRAKQPGTVTLTVKGITGRVATTADRALLAVVREVHTGGGNGFESQLDIYRVETGTLVSTTPFMARSESNESCDSSDEKAKDCTMTPAGRKAVARRAEGLQRMLRELGFAPAVIEPATTTEYGGHYGKNRFTLPKHKLGVVENNGLVRVLQRNTELATGSIPAGIGEVVLVEQPRVLLVWSSNPGSENGCLSGQGSYVTVMQVKTP